MFEHVAGRCSTYSKAAFLDVPYYPQQFIRAQGAYLWDTQGKRYIDWTASLGAILTGYYAVNLQDICPLLPGPHPQEEQTAALLCSLTGWDQVRWCKNGSDATEAAVRIARCVTGRSLILVNSYHGAHSDVVCATKGKGGGVLDECWGTIESAPSPTRLRELIDEQTAAVLIEPMTWDCLDWQLSTLRKRCLEVGALLIFDEMLTGFRLRCGSAVDIRPDLACYGKIIGNGFPIACLAGPKKYMEVLTDRVFMSGTYAAENLSLIQCAGVLMMLSENPQWYTSLQKTGARLQAALQDVAQGYPQRLHITLPDSAHCAFISSLAQQGILVGRDFFPMVSHRKEELEKTLEAIAVARKSY